MTRVQLSVDGGVAHVRLDRPDKHNGLDAAMFAEIEATGVSLIDRRDVRAVVVSGAGPSFCAGLDFMSFMGAFSGAGDTSAQGTGSAMTHLLDRPPGSIANHAQRVAWVWREVPVPVVAALHGAVYGGGLQIALGADVRFAAPSTRMSVMELRYGLIPDMGITATLLPLVRPDVAADLIYTGRVVQADEALALGLVTRIADDPLAAAMAWATQVAAASPHAIRAARRLLREAADLNTPQGLALEAELQVPLLGTPNQMEAVAATLMKRAPTFSDP